MDKISVIVPVYNVEKYLSKCINSILKQTYKNLEILLINDGSKDNSGYICDKYAKKDSRIRVIHKENSGLSATRNLGIELSTGKYIAFIDSDDFIREDFLEVLHSILVKTKSDISSVSLKMVREDGYKNITSDDTKNKVFDSKIHVFKGNEILKEILLRKSFKSYICTKLYKKEIFNFCKFKEGISYEDNLFMYEISKYIDKVAYINDECYYYLKRKNSITATPSLKNLNDFLDVIIYRYEDIKQRNIVPESYNVFALLESIISVSIKYVISNKQYEEVIKKSNYIFEIIREFMSKRENEISILPLLSDSPKVCLYLIVYNQDLFYSFLKSRHEMQVSGTFKEYKKTPRICLLCDKPNWAFDTIAKKLKKELSHKYNIRIDYFDMYTEPDKLFECMERNSDCDIIHVFWRKTLLLFESNEFINKVRDKGLDIDVYLKTLKNKLSTGVYDFLYLDKENISKYKNIFNCYVNNYYVTSKKLYEEYIKVDEYIKPKKIIHDVYNSDIFKPINLEKYDINNINNRELVIGWVGNSQRKVDGIDLKGLHTIIKPAIKELQDEGYNIKEQYADRMEKWRSSDEMFDYYGDIDICLCTSIHEGTPLPILEAMACGVPIISTNVGIVPEIFGEEQNKFNIGDRINDRYTINKLKEKIIDLYNNRYLFKILSEENIKSIEKYNITGTLKLFEEYFDDCLKGE